MIDLAGSLHEQQFCQSAEGCVKTRNDLARYREVIAKTKPSVVVECGTFSGKSALWFARETGGHVITVDVTTNSVDRETRVQRLWGERVHSLIGSSIDSRIVSRVVSLTHQLSRGSVMVVLDSWHGSEHVYEELLAYSSLVTVGSYLVVEDTIVNWCPWELRPDGPYDGSPLDAVRLFMRGRGEEMFEIDAQLENMLPTTQHPSGWLRRR